MKRASEIVLHHTTVLYICTEYSLLKDNTVVDNIITDVTRR